MRRLISPLLTACILYSLPACSQRTPAVSTRLVQRDLAPAVTPSLPELPLADPTPAYIVPAPAAAHHAEKAPASKERAGASTLLGLMEGNQRFVEGKQIHPHQSQAQRDVLAGGQTPQAIILSCSDSRVPPELVFDQGLGDLFVVRTAGAVAESSVIASIEYAIEHLGSDLLVIMGHQSCGAVQAALTTPPNHSAGSAHLDLLLRMIRPAAVRGAQGHSGSVPIEAVKANVDAIAHDIPIKSKIIEHAISSGKLGVVKGLYYLDGGRVDFWF